MQSQDYKTRRRLGASRQIGTEYKCEICGEAYILTGGLQRFCKRCAPLHLKEADNAQSRAWNSAHPAEMRDARQREKKRYREIANDVSASYSLAVDTTCIRSLRATRSMCRSSLANVTGISEKTLYNYETAKRGSGSPSLLNLEHIAAALGMTNRDLLRCLYHDTDTPLFRAGGAVQIPALSADLSRLELLHTRKGMTAHAVSVKAGLDPYTLYDLEAHTHQDVRISTLERIASALDMRPLDLLLFLYD